MLEREGEFDRLDAVVLTALGLLFFALFLRSIEAGASVSDVLFKLVGFVAVLSCFFLYALHKKRTL